MCVFLLGIFVVVSGYGLPRLDKIPDPEQNSACLEMNTLGYAFNDKIYC